jgi:hypothetical protein
MSLSKPPRSLTKAGVGQAFCLPWDATRYAPNNPQNNAPAGTPVMALLHAPRAVKLLP